MSDFRSRLVIILAVLAGTVGAVWAPAGPAVARDWYVPAQAPTIQAAVDSAVTGDTVVIAAGTYTDCTQLNGNGVAHIAILRNGIHLRGETGDPADVVLDAAWQGRCLEMRSLADTTRISGLTFRRGRALNPFGSGGGVFAFGAHPEFRSCVFDSCEADYAGGGVSVGSGSLVVEDCVFIDCASPNIGAAVRTTGSDLTLTGSTVFRSRGPAIHYATEQPVITRTIIAGGDGKAITRNNSADPVPDISCTDIWGNGEDWTDFLAGLDQTGGNLTADPLFCNPLFGELGLYSTSPCAPSGGDCDLIGAQPVTCGGVAVTYLVRADGSGDFATIQDALNAAADADTVALADGVFTGDGNRDLDFLGKGVVVRGLNRDADLAIIDCGGSAAEPHRGAHFFRGETTFAVLSHLTIRNADVADDGAALRIENSSPRIENVVLTANHAERGAAAFVQGGDPSFVDCEIFGNEGRAFAGGLALLASEATVTGCVFRNNWGQRASALFLPDSCDVVVRQTTFNANNSAGDRAGIELEGSSKLALVNCQLTNGNRTALNSFGTSSATATWTNVYGNAEGNWVGGLAGQGFSSGNLSVDPLYCDPAAFDFHLRGDSACASYNSGNSTPMGAFAVGCDAPSHFSDVSGGLPGASGRVAGITWLDYNGDGNLDLHVGRPTAQDDFLLGSGSGVFNALPNPISAATDSASAVAWADFDGDGDWDAYYSRPTGGNVAVTWAGLTPTVADLPTLTGNLSGPAAMWGDFNQDSRLDLLVVRPDTACVLLRQEADGAFHDASADMDLTWQAPWTGGNWVDYDNDGRLDLYLLAESAPNQLLHNLATGFEKVGAALVQDAGRARSAAWADYNRDGRPDLLLVNENGATRILRQVGSGSFTAVTVAALLGTVPGRSGTWADFDNDGDLDVFLTRSGKRDQLLRNEGSDIFLDVGDPVFAATDSSTGAAWGDYDGDGDLDLAVGDQSGAVRLYRNDLAGANHWLQVRPQGANGAAAMPGTEVWIRPADGPDQVRELGTGGGWQSRDAMVAHFGLGTAALIDSLRVTWPDGSVHAMANVAVDQLLVATPASVSAVDDGQGGQDGVPRLRTALGTVAPNPFNPVTRIRFSTAARGRVALRVYDVAGRQVAVLVDDVVPAGEHEAGWRGRDQRGRTVAAGVYFVRLVADGNVWTRPITLVK